MESIYVRQRLRPTRYAFLVDENDLAAAVQAVSVNTALWGGRYNPIIPVTPQEKRDALLAAFDTDVAVNLTHRALPAEIQTSFEHRIVAPEDIIDEHYVTRRRSLKLGFNILPLLRGIHEREVRFSAEPTRAAVIMAETAGSWAEFAAFAYGSFNWLPQLDIDFGERFRRALRAREVPLPVNTAPANYEKLLVPIQFTGFSLRVYRGQGSFSTHIVFLGDHTSVADLIEFWNIRATGRTVEFVPVAAPEAFESVVRGVATEGHYPINPQVENEADLQKGPSVPNDRFMEICDWIATLGLPAMPRRDRAPRYNIDIEWYVGDIHVGECEAVQSEEISLLENSRLTPVKLLAPPYLEDERVQRGQYTWSVEIDFSGGWDNDLMFSFPRAPAVEAVVRRAIVGSPWEARLGKRGLVHQEDVVSSRLHLMPVETKDVFAALFKGAGLDAEPSQPGRYAEQIIKKMGPHLQFDCRIFKLRGVREILGRLSDGSVLTKGNMFDIVMSRVPDVTGAVNWRPELYDDLFLRARQRRPLDFGPIFEELLEKRIIRPGFEFRCTNCGKNDWYHVSEFTEEYTCRYCFERQRVNFASIGTQWQYKADGLFQIRDSALGSVAVILALWRLEHIGDPTRGRYTTCLNLRDPAAGEACEIDYAYVLTEMFSTDYSLVLGQAANFGDFTDDDMRWMRSLADRFNRKPYLAFTTLRDAFSDADKQRLRRLADDGYHVIALTREELDPYDLHRRFEHAPQKYAINFRELSQNTIHLNLG